MKLHTLPALLKYKVSVAVTFTAITGYVVHTGQFDLRILWLILGVFTLAGGSSGLNEYQESRFDAQMNRTKNRPIPSGEISPKSALLVSLFFCFMGTAVLYYFTGLTTALLGIFNIIWYNLLYTNLKRITPFAVVPGSLTGAVPVLMGWCAAGGYLFDPAIVYIAFFLFIWQIPHFWLLMLKYGKEYEAAGFPTINQAVHPEKLRFVIYSWIVATSFASILVPVFLTHISLPFFMAIFAFNVLFVSIFTRLSLGHSTQLNFRKSFVSLNIYMFLFMIILIAFHLM